MDFGRMIREKIQGMTDEEKELYDEEKRLARVNEIKNKARRDAKGAFKK